VDCYLLGVSVFRSHLLSRDVSSAVVVYFLVEIGVNFEEFNTIVIMATQIPEHAPPYASFFGSMGSASAIIFTGATSACIMQHPVT